MFLQPPLPKFHLQRSLLNRVGCPSSFQCAFGRARFGSRCRIPWHREQAVRARTQQRGRCPASGRRPASLSHWLRSTGRPGESFRVGGCRGRSPRGCSGPQTCERPSVSGWRAEVCSFSVVRRRRVLLYILWFELTLHSEAAVQGGSCESLLAGERPSRAFAWEVLAGPVLWCVSSWEGVFGAGAASRGGPGLACWCPHSGSRGGWRKSQRLPSDPLPPGSTPRAAGGLGRRRGTFTAGSGRNHASDKWGLRPGRVAQVAGASSRTP